MESAISQSATSIWWSKIGKWRLLGVIVTLAAYFITLYFSGDSKTAVAIASLVAAFFGTFFTPAVAIAAFATAFVVGLAVIAGMTTVVITLAITFDSVTAFISDGTEYGDIVVSKKVLWLSFAAEFTLTLVPMLISILR